MAEAPTSGEATGWRPRSAWAGLARPGRHGATDGAPGLHLTCRDGLGLAILVAADDRDKALAERLGARFPGCLPTPGKALIVGERGLISSGPGQWLAVAEAPSVLDSLAEDLRGLASVTEQSDSRAVLRVAGPRARDVLSKGLAIDLHPRAFRPGDAAVTRIAQTGAQIWQLDDAPTYDIAVPRSFAGSVWSWFSEASAEFGYTVEAPSGRAA